MKRTLQSLISWIISIVFHPLIYAFAGSFVLLWFVPEFDYLHPEVLSRYLSRIFFLTYVLPLFFVPIIYLFYKFSGSEFNSKNFRLFLLLVTASFYLYSYHIIQSNTLFANVNYFILLCALQLCISAAITYFWRISLHMIGIGGFIGLLFFLVVYAGIYPKQLLAISVLVAGLVAYARLILKAHTQLQIYVGFACGFLVSTTYLFLLFGL